MGSSGGIRVLQAGAIDIAVISRPLEDAERAQGVIGTEYARMPLVFATAAKMNLSNFTTSELVSIYAGERKTWPDGSPLRLVLLPEKNSDTVMSKASPPP